MFSYATKYFVETKIKQAHRLLIP